MPVHFMSVIVLQIDVSLKFGTCSITGQWGEFRINNATLQFHILFGVFFCFVFHHRICVFIFFDEVSNFAREY